MKFSKRFGEYEENILMKLDSAKRKIEQSGNKVINLSIGTPDFPPSQHILEAVSNAALEPEYYKYGMTESPELIDAVIKWYWRRYNVKIDSENIAAVNGSQEGIAHIAFPLCDKDDIVLVPDPGYPIFSFGPSLTGAEIVKLPLLKENNYLIDFESIDNETAKKAKMMMVSYPMNPVAACANEEFYKKLVKFSEENDIIIIHDNAYSELIYDSKPGISYLSIDGAINTGIEFNSLSKSYNLTGLRISFAIGNKEIIQRFKRFRSQIDYGICFAVQTAAIAALNGPQDSIENNRKEYKKRRDALCKGLNNIGWNVPFSEGTMFTWFPIPPKYKSSVEFTYELLEKANVLCVPGISFGELGEGYVRMALVQPVEVLEKAIKQISESGILN